MCETLGYTLKKDQCVVVENSPVQSVIHDVLFQGLPREDYGVIEGNCNFLAVYSV